MRLRIAASLFALVVLTGPAGAVAIVKRTFVPGPGVPTLPCAIQLDFGGEGAGPDMDGWAPVSDYIAASKVIEDAQVWGWGTDGQFSVCMQLTDPGDLKTTFEDLKKLAPATPAPSSGPTVVRLGTEKL